MLSKIGIENLDKSKFDFLSLQQKERLITLPPNLDLKEVISMMIIPEVIETELIESNLYLKINIKTKMVYSISDGRMKMFEDDQIIIRAIKLDKKIKGTEIFYLYNNNKLLTDIKLADFRTKIVDTNRIFVDMYLFIGIKCKAIYNLIIRMEDAKGHENIFISSDTGQGLKNINDECSGVFKEVKFIQGSNNISYIKNEDGNSSLCIYKINEDRNISILENSRVNSYTFIDNQRLILDYEDDVGKLYLYDVRQKSQGRVIKTRDNIKLTSPFYRDDIGRLFFIKSEGKNFTLCSVNSGFKDIKEHINVEEDSYKISNDSEYIAMLNNENIMLYNIELDEIFSVKYPKDISKNTLKFFDMKDENKMLLGAEIQGIYNFYMFNDKRKIFEKIAFEIEASKIASVILGYDEGSIIAGIESFGYYNVYKINRAGTTSEIINLYAEKIYLNNKK